MKYLYIIFSFLFVQLNAQNPLYNTEWKLTSYFYSGENVEVPNDNEVEEVLISFGDNTFNTWVCGGVEGEFDVYNQTNFNYIMIDVRAEYLTDCSSVNSTFQQSYLNLFLNIEGSYGALSYESLDNTLTLTDSYENTATYSRHNLLVNELLELKEISIYPNPVKETLFIHGLEGVEYSYEILNVLGQIISSKHSKTENNIKINSLKAGLYFIRIQIGDKVQNIKFIKD